MFSIPKLAKLAGLLAAVAGAAVFALPAAASPVPPLASTSLNGVWINTNAATGGVKQIVIQPVRTGTVSVDAFGACVPTLCEWGKVNAIVYGPSAAAKSGTSFQSNQYFKSGTKEWSRTQLFGTLATSRTGNVLTVREFTAFEDGSGRKNYTTTETFKLGKQVQAVTKSGLPTVQYVLGARPVANAGLLGTWVPSGSSSNLAKVVIGGTAAAPKVHSYGVCSPSPCDWGTVNGITYGATISTARGTTELAPYTFSFKRTQLLIKYSIDTNDVEHLTVVTYNEFTDGSGRSNYTVTQNLVRA